MLCLSRFQKDYFKYKYYKNFILDMTVGLKNRKKIKNSSCSWIVEGLVFEIHQFAQIPLSTS